MKKKISNKIIEELVNIGVSKQESSIYTLLLEEGVMAAKDIALHLNILPNAVYRTTESLEEKGLVGILKTSPITYQAVSPDLALSFYIERRIKRYKDTARKVSDLVRRKGSKAQATKVEVVFGKYNTYRIGAEMVEEAKKEFLVISIGENIPQRLLLATSRASKRGVIMRMIAHKNNEENKHILEGFKKNGYEIRHFPDWGFHLTVIDSMQSLIIVNNPDDPRERVGIRIFSNGLSKALREYFYSIWEKARVV